MKRLVLLAAISFALCMNAFGQIHKAFGDKPLFSHHYTFADNNDSVADFKTIYTYNAINQLTKSISFPFITDERINVDSTVRIYDANDRIISSTSYSYGAAYYSEQWIYDTLNKEINCYSYFYSEGGAKDSIFHIFYQGVHDFDNVPSSIISASIFELFSGFVIDCDSVFIKAPNQTTSLLETMYTVYPVYQNGKIISSKTVMKSFDISILLPGMSLVVDLTVDYLYTYSGDKLMNMNGNITIVPVLLPVPVTLSDAITTINQYDNNDLLIESTSAI
ncbi:MAG: hypothetical protein LBE13_15390, partial [Bacteroidales bacterium]|nr:hypothetical protein [Bacteroidales bacterium]